MTGSHKIKNWARFQHYKKGKYYAKPEWIKLYRNLLDDMEWHELDGEDAKVLVMLWMLASENGGTLPSIKKIAFRLRLKEDKISTILNRLPHWVEPLEKSYTDSIPDKDIDIEVEEEKREESFQRGGKEFNEWWSTYPKKEAITSARREHWKALNKASADVLLNGAKRMADLVRCGEIEHRFVPKPANWLADERWLDGPQASSKPKHEQILDRIVDKYHDNREPGICIKDGEISLELLPAKPEVGDYRGICGELDSNLHGPVYGEPKKNGQSN